MNDIKLVDPSLCYAIAASILIHCYLDAIFIFSRVLSSYSGAEEERVCSENERMGVSE